MPTRTTPRLAPAPVFVSGPMMRPIGPPVGAASFQHPHQPSPQPDYRHRRPSIPSTPPETPVEIYFSNHGPVAHDPDAPRTPPSRESKTRRSISHFHGLPSPPVTPTKGQHIVAPTQTVLDLDMVMDDPSVPAAYSLASSNMTRRPSQAYEHHRRESKSTLARLIAGDATAVTAPLHSTVRLRPRNIVSIALLTVSALYFFSLCYGAIVGRVEEQMSHVVADSKNWGARRAAVPAAAAQLKVGRERDERPAVAAPAIVGGQRQAVAAEAKQQKKDDMASDSIVGDTAQRRAWSGTWTHHAMPDQVEETEQPSVVERAFTNAELDDGPVSDDELGDDEAYAGERAEDAVHENDGIYSNDGEMFRRHPELMESGRGPQVRRPFVDVDEPAAAVDDDDQIAALERKSGTGRRAGGPNRLAKTRVVKSSNSGTGSGSPPKRKVKAKSHAHDSSPPPPPSNKFERPPVVQANAFVAPAPAAPAVDASVEDDRDSFLESKDLPPAPATKPKIVAQPQRGQHQLNRMKKMNAAQRVPARVGSVAPLDSSASTEDGADAKDEVIIVKNGGNGAGSGSKRKQKQLLSGQRQFGRPAA